MVLGAGKKSEIRLKSEDSVPWQHFVVALLFRYNRDGFLMCNDYVHELIPFSHKCRDLWCCLSELIHIGVGLSD